ncbi:D-alanyl-D-alanine carboxypeptidase [Roseiarcaceae bacterium H3SJ34-1]|uniref:D-alanyl-D-alanine carboxypeptidase family protein n=1 Tax=Terripilifer ovatus TaxID=3032367 RepID=UPI003AB97FB4|nr:D-alanyl-D-alanine carboxypeptidase [Roseiarcaceae bacterium H3SJ34-1]
MKRFPLAIVAGLFVCASNILSPANATPALIIDVGSGEVLYQEEATRPWYPASTTKLMTVYVALKAVRDGRITLDTPLLVSNRAARMQPSKMGLRPGTEITLDNALKILMVKSANDLAVTIAEGVSGSVPAFAAEMNSVARQIGMRESHFVNPNGLHDEAHYSSARDLAILGRALYLNFPQQHDLFGIGALRLGTKIIPTHNGILGRYPGADGMKTGFVCASGFNVVASATRGGRRLIAVVLGSPNAKSRTLKVMSMLDAAFAGQTHGGGNVATLADWPDQQPPNMRAEICGRNRNRNIEEDFGVPISSVSAPAQAAQMDSSAAFFAADRERTLSPILGFAGVNTDLGPRPVFDPIPIFIGRAPGWTGAVAHAETPDEPPDPDVDQKTGKKLSPAARRAAARAIAAATAAEAKKTAAKPAAKTASKATAGKAASDKPAKDKAAGGKSAGSKAAKAAPRDKKPQTKAEAKPAKADKKVENKPAADKKLQSAKQTAATPQ